MSALTPGRIDVLVADDHDLVRDALTRLIDGDRGMRVVGAARDADEAIRLAGSMRPDVVLLDVRMPRGGGRRAAAGIRRLSGSTYIVALSAEPSDRVRDEMLAAGADEYFVKGDAKNDIRGAIRRAADARRLQLA